jgi:hypothetical protein
VPSFGVLDRLKSRMCDNWEDLVERGDVRGGDLFGLCLRFKKLLFKLKSYMYMHIV